MGLFSDVRNFLCVSMNSMECAEVLLFFQNVFSNDLSLILLLGLLSPVVCFETPFLYNVYFLYSVTFVLFAIICYNFV